MARESTVLVPTVKCRFSSFFLLYTVCSCFTEDGVFRFICSAPNCHARWYVRQQHNGRWSLKEQGQHNCDEKHGIQKRPRQSPKVTSVLMEEVKKRRVKVP